MFKEIKRDENRKKNKKDLEDGQKWKEHAMFGVDGLINFRTTKESFGLQPVDVLLYQKWTISCIARK